MTNKKVEKIITLEKKLKQVDQDKKKYKIEKKVERIKEDFKIKEVKFVDLDYNEDEKSSIIYVEKKTKRETLVDGDLIIPLNYIPQTFNTNFLSFILAHFCLLMIYFLCMTMHLVGIIVTESFFNSLGLVVASATIVLNVWTFFACKDVVLKFRTLIVVIALSLIFNTFNVIRHVQDILL